MSKMEKTLFSFFGFMRTRVSSWTLHIRKKSKFSKIFNFSECHHKVLKWSPLSVFEPGNGFYLKFFAFLLGVASSGARARPHEAEPNRRFEEKSKNTHTPLGNLNEKIRKSGYTEF